AESSTAPTATCSASSPSSIPPHSTWRCRRRGRAIGSPSRRSNGATSVAVEGCRRRSDPDAAVDAGRDDAIDGERLGDVLEALLTQRLEDEPGLDALCRHRAYDDV